jgi:hypothetical protein
MTVLTARQLRASERPHCREAGLPRPTAHEWIKRRGRLGS